MKAEYKFKSVIQIKVVRTNLCISLVEMSSISLLYWFVDGYFFIFKKILLLFIRKVVGPKPLPPNSIRREEGTDRLYLVPFKVPAQKNIDNKG